MPAAFCMYFTPTNLLLVWALRAGSWGTFCEQMACERSSPLRGDKRQGGMRGDHQREQMPLGAYRNRLFPYTRHWLVPQLLSMEEKPFSCCARSQSENWLCNSKVAELREQSFRCVHVRFLVCAWENLIDRSHYKQTRREKHSNLPPLSLQYISVSCSM